MKEQERGNHVPVTFILQYSIMWKVFRTLDFTTSQHAVLGFSILHQMVHAGFVA